MASEVVEGKRTFIERRGNVFELPKRHIVKLVPLGDGTTMVSLTALIQGSTFQLRKLEELKDRVIVHLGPELGRHGSPGGEALGYPFPGV
jgi:hypothetical protein